jgi:hypothetical protein
MIQFRHLALLFAALTLSVSGQIVNPSQGSSAALAAETAARVAADANLQPLRSELTAYGLQGSDIPSASTTNIGAATGLFVNVTGTQTISSFGTAPAGTVRIVKFTAGPGALFGNPPALTLPGGGITRAAGDTGVFVSLGAGNWICASYQRANGESIVATNPFDQTLNTNDNVYFGSITSSGAISSNYDVMASNFFTADGAIAIGPSSAGVPAALIGLDSNGAIFSQSYSSAYGKVIIDGNGINIDAALTLLDGRNIYVSGLVKAGSVMTHGNVPAATDGGEPGQMIFTNTHTYRCFADGDWRRVAVTYTTY